jgi:hypothetical protein
MRFVERPQKLEQPTVQPLTSGRAYPTVNGNVMKATPAIKIAIAIRRECVRSSDPSTQRRKDTTKNKSMLRYGMMDRDTNGICFSHGKETGPQVVLRRKGIAPTVDDYEERRESC